jgi:hypothetical protein
MNTRYIRLFCAILVLTLSSLACGIGSSSVPVSEDNPTISQWGASASASSEYGSSGWTAEQAIGVPDTTGCADYTTAWASASADTVEWLQLTYVTPVHATQVITHITYNPSYVTKVELIDTNGKYHTVYTAQPSQMTCPAELAVSFDKTSYLVTGVKITVDQTTLNSWNEIDAVQLIGTAK